jgi:formylmethanofuran dehydrogenase subunit E
MNNEKIMLAPCGGCSGITSLDRIISYGKDKTRVGNGKCSKCRDGIYSGTCKRCNGTGICPGCKGAGVITIG